MGNSLSPGVYSQVHSAHPHAVNLLREDFVCTVCARNISPGSARIVIDADEVQEIKEVRVGDRRIWIDQTQEIEISSDRIYQNPHFPRVESDQIKQRLRIEAAEFFAKCPPESVAGLIRGANEASGSYLGALGESFRQGRDLMSRNDWQAGVRCFKGKGLGLTPSGDDWLAGFLTGFVWLERILEQDWSDRRNRLLNLCLGKDPLVNSILRQTAELALDQDWAEFLISLQLSEADPSAKQDRILATGSTSGADTLSGFHCACEILL